MSGFRIRGCHTLWPDFPDRFANLSSPMSESRDPTGASSGGLGCSAFARHYLRNRIHFLFLGLLRCFTSPRSLHWPMNSTSDILTDGLPHSEIPGSQPTSGSPRLIAGSHVLHRLSVPRHPPQALSSLIIFIFSRGEPMFSAIYRLLGKNLP